MKRMKRQVLVLFAAGLLMAGIPAATAAVQAPSGSARASLPGNDTLSLTTTQRTTVWNDLQKRATEQKALSHFKPIVGSAVPSSITIEPVPGKAASDISSMKPYDYAMTQGKLLIVNPSDKKIVAELSDTKGT